MTLRNTSDSLERKHIWMDKDDWQWVCETFAGKMTPSEAIRLIIRKYRQGIEARLASKLEGQKKETANVGP